MPVAVNCWRTPTGKLALDGVTAMEDRVAGIIVRVVLPQMLPEVAEMMEVPTATAVARPMLLTVATDVFDDLQVTCVVISWLVPSEYMPVAVNCWGTIMGMIAEDGVTAMEDRVAGITVRSVLPEMLPEMAVMMDVPAATAVATPLLSTVATDVLDEVQVTCVVMSRLVPLE